MSAAEHSRARRLRTCRTIGREMPGLRRAFLVLPLALAFAAPIAAAEIQPALVYSLGDKFDASFNEAAFDGAERFRKESGIAYRDFETTAEVELEQAHRKFAQRGADPIVGVGFLQTKAVATVAEEFPDTRFTVIDTVVKAPNVQSVVFKEHEGSFLVGILAAMATKTGTIGFVGGMDIPLIRRFLCGYRQGALYADPGIRVIANMTGTTPAAWTDPGRGAELARGQFERGVDVIFAAAGTTGLGVLQAAADAGKLSVGVDSNQNHLHPGSVLTSMVKRVDLAVYESFQAARSGTWQAGFKALGLAEQGVDWALDEHNSPLVDEAMRAKVEAARRAIVAGEIAVHDYMSDNACPA